MDPDWSKFLNPKPLNPKLKSLIIKEHSTTHLDASRIVGWSDEEQGSVVES
jgi:hypothetical protein